MKRKVILKLPTRNPYLSHCYRNRQIFNRITMILYLTILITLINLQAH